jgi:hypothetical protein
MVPGKIFQGINFLDSQVLYSEGSKTFDRCLEAANIDKVEDRNALLKALISCAQYYLNKDKGHVQHKIREAATHKYLLKHKKCI